MMGRELEEGLIRTPSSRGTQTEEARKGLNLLNNLVNNPFLPA